MMCTDHALILYINRVRRERDQKRLQVRSELSKLADAIPVSTKQHILSLTATQLADAISKNELTSTDAVTVYSYRALQAGELLNCNAEELYIEAINQAKTDDSERNNQRKQLGLKDGDPLPNRRLLEGVPISVKVCDHVHDNCPNINNALTCIDCVWLLGCIYSTWLFIYMWLC